jgi:hypothetical protein
VPVRDPSQSASAAPLSASVEPLKPLPQPEWWMFQRESSKIDGLQRFRLIVEAPAKTNIRGTISFGAALKGRRGLLRYQVPLHDATQLDWLVIKAAAGKVWPGRSK